ncbi:MAG TPA: hypothetical protein VJ908_08810 [Wenzhouxiangellaceae bacterium]|nr:hypothetical protein [Wenzhouxiangellaceae bacterium]
MVKRQIQALAAGICIAIIVQESTWIGLDLLDPTRSLNESLAHAPLVGGWLAPLLAAWIAGGVFGALMATLVGRNRFIGHVVGLLLSGSALLIAALSLPGAGSVLTIAATPSLGAALGTWLGIFLSGKQPKNLMTPSIVTLSRTFR